MERARILLVATGLLLVAGCAGPQRPSVGPTPGPALSPTSQEALPTYSGLPLPTERGDLFSGSGACSICHTDMVDESSADVSIDAAWRAAMMANAARDPYWQASVRAEALDNPDYQAIIEDKCATCHMPMAQVTAAASGGQGSVLDGGFLAPESELHALAMDGVSCTLCHQIEETELGQPSSFSGGFVIDTDLPASQRLAYGPYVVPEGLATAMQASSGYLPVQGLHIGRSELCATCHTLYTPFIDATGQIAGEFPEQVAYLELAHSDFEETHVCQDCHMPLANGGVQLSVTGGPPRSPFFRHLFVGGNAYILRVFRTFGQELEVTASSDQFEVKIEDTLDQLRGHTATLAVEEASVSGSRLTASVVVRSLVGHKFPTGFPARRAWLHLVVQDAEGEIIFESGAFSADGSIAGNENDADSTSYEPHHLEIVDPDQVQIYESIMRDSEGEVTTGLLHGAGYLKDNRLLPVGFDKGTTEENVAVHGQAMEDEDFLGGGDTVRYAVELGDAPGPFTVTAELLYQSVGYRWAKNLGRHEAPEIARFLAYYGRVSNHPAIIAETTVQVAEGG